MSDPMTRAAAYDRIVAMQGDNGTTWDLSEKDQEALRHAVQAFLDADNLDEALKDAEASLADGALQHVALGYLARAEKAEAELAAARVDLEAYRVQHELVGEPADLAAEVQRLRMALVKIESTPCSDECGCCGMDGRTAHDALVSTSATPTKSETPT